MLPEIRDPKLADRIHRQMERTGATNAEEMIARLLETQEEVDKWLLHSRVGVDAKLNRGIEQLEQGDCVHEDELDGWLAARKFSQP